MAYLIMALEENKLKQMFWFFATPIFYVFGKWWCAFRKKRLKSGDHMHENILHDSNLMQDYSPVFVHFFFFFNGWLLYHEHMIKRIQSHSKIYWDCEIDNWKPSANTFAK